MGFFGSLSHLPCPAPCPPVPLRPPPINPLTHSLTPTPLAPSHPLSLEQEAEKLKALRKSIEASKKHLEQLEKDHEELEKSVKKE